MTTTLSPPRSISVDTLPCRTHDPEVFFAEAPSEVEYAKGLCRTCPLQAECLAGALERREPWGVWGGEIFQAGVVIERKRPRGRPRKHPLPAQEVNQNGIHTGIQTDIHTGIQTGNKRRDEYAA